jgi:hypothetical protein
MCDNAIVAEASIAVANFVVVITGLIINTGYSKHDASAVDVLRTGKH